MKRRYGYVSPNRNKSEEILMKEQEHILDSLQSKVKDKLWNGQEWMADYRRLRVIAHVN
jgi:hypothetical protein